MFDPAAHPALAEVGPRLRELAGDAAYKAGRDYHKKGLVRQAAVAGTSAFATVTGSTDYRISVAFGGEEPKVSCTCPAHRRSKYCKHVVAVVTALLEEPHGFAITEPAPAVEVEPRKGRTGAKKPKEDKSEVRAAGLATLDSLLEELAAGGLVTLGPEQVQLIAGAGELVRALKLRRLGNQIMRLQRAAAGARGLEAGEFGGLLGDLYLTRAATGAHLEGRASLDPALAEDLLGKTWREGDLEPVRDLELVELAATRESDGEFTVETGYLFDLRTGQLFTEKLISPARMGSATRTIQRHRLLVDEAGLYPGPAPRRIKLIKARRAPLQRDHAAAVVAAAETTAVGLRRRLVERLSTPFGPVELPVLFRPAALVIQGALTVALDGQGRFVALDLPGGTGQKEMAELLPEPGGYALCGLLREEGAGLGLACLSVISPDLRWWRGPIFPDGTVRGRR